MRSWWVPAAAATAALALLVSAVALVVAVTDDDRGHGAMMSSSGRYGDGSGRVTPRRDGGMPGMLGGMPGMRGGGAHAMSVSDEHDWLVQMIAHHEEAIDAAGELDRSRRPEMRDLGATVVGGQTAQVEQMASWLERWYPDREHKTDYAPMMRDLSGLSGDELDRVFLEDMIGHHMMAVMMSQRLLMTGSAEHEAVAGLAAEIRDEQHAEIVTMQRWLRAWF